MLINILKKVQRIPHYVDNGIYSRLSTMLEFTYGLRTQKLRSILEQPVYQMMQLEGLLNQNGAGVLYHIRGTAKVDHRPLSVAFIGTWEIGQRNSLPFFQHLMFDEGTTEVECLGEYPARQFQRVAQNQAGQVDLVAYKSTNLLTWRPDHGDWVIGPDGIRMVFDFDSNETWADYERRMRKQNENIRRLKKAGFQYCISDREEDFSYFYHQMHVPMVKTRYQDYGDILHEQGLLLVFRKKGHILLIKDSTGSVVSGGFQYVNRGVLYGLLNGVRDGDETLIKKGALNALYYFGIKWAFEQGLTRFDVGLCPSFVTNGLFQHKRRWGLQPELNYWKPNSMLFWAPHSSPSALSWMKAHLFLPQFAKWGGSNMEPVYAELVRQPESAAV
jgi:hypothetical protein